MIGIIGAYGYVGIFATRFLFKHSGHTLRIGGRNISKIPEEIKKEFCSAESIRIDATNESELNAFFAGCECILDATSLPDKDVLVIDAMAEKHQIPVVHLGITGFEKKDTSVPILYGAGSIPGLSGVLSQYLSDGFDSIEELNFCFGGSGTLSESSAKDYLEGICRPNNHSMVYWQDGCTQPINSTPPNIDFFDSRLSEYRQFPYFDEESESISKKLQIKTGHWQMCIPGKRVLAELDSARYHYKQDPQKTIKSLCIASKLDMFGSQEDALFYCSIKGTKCGISCEKQLTLSGISPRENTGETAAAAVIALLKNKVENKKMLLGESDLYKSIVETFLMDKRIKMNILIPGNECEGEI